MEKQTNEKFYLLVNDGGDFIITEIREADYCGLANLENMHDDGLIPTQIKKEAIASIVKELMQRYQSSELLYFHEMESDN